MKKKWILGAAAILALLALFWFLPKGGDTDRVNFYYPRKNYAYGTPEGAIGWEARDVGHRKRNLPYLLAIYLEGPFHPDLEAPFPGPNRRQVQTLTQSRDQVTITLADLGVGLTDSQFNLSCACIAKTALELTDVQRVKITSGERSVVMTRENLLLFDESTSAPTEEDGGKK